MQRRKFFDGALDKDGQINAAGGLEGSQFQPLGPQVEKRKFFTGALEKDAQLNAGDASAGSGFSPLGPSVGAVKRAGALTTTGEGRRELRYKLF